MNNEEISKEALEDLYWKKGLSLSKIAKQYNMKSPNAVTYHMQKFNLSRRPSSRKDSAKNPFSGKKDEKAYLIGLRTGDINARKHCRQVVACTTSPKQAQMKMFRTTFEKYSPVNEYEAKGGFTEKTRKINCFLHPSFDFLIEKPKAIPEWILDSKELFYSFLAGYCDSEASWIITKHKKYGGRWKDLVFSLGTCDKTILEQINQKLKELGFNSHFYLVRRKGVYGTRICNLDLYRVMITSHKDVVKLAETLLPLSKHEEKQAAKLRIINYEKKNIKIKILKKKNLGTVNIECTNCGHKKVWRNGFKKYKSTKYLRYKCPLCKREFEEGKINA
ncbi:MAG: LAGLIDADG family homing endonuclease [archaeon]